MATTRAREELIVSQWTGSHASIQQPWAVLSPFLSEAPCSRQLTAHPFEWKKQLRVNSLASKPARPV